MVTGRLGLVILVDPGQGVQKRSLTLNTEAVAMARRLGDRSALGYALSARMHTLSGIGSAPERLATGTEAGEIAEDTGDELLALHGHMWHVRGLLAQGDVDAVSEEIMHFSRRETGPVHPRETSFAWYVAAMMALVAGDFETAESSAREAIEVAAGDGGEALTFFGGLMIWTWWRHDELASPESGFWEVAAQAPAAYPTVRAILALAHAESGETEAGLAALRSLSDLGLLTAAEDRTEGVSLAMSRRRLQCHRRRVGQHGVAPVRGDAPVRRHRHRDPGPGDRVPGPRRPVSRPAGRCHGRQHAGRGALRGRAQDRAPDGGRTLRGGGGGRAGQDAAPARP